MGHNLDFTSENVTLLLLALDIKKAIIAPDMYKGYVLCPCSTVMGRREKKFNKWLIGIILGSAILGISGLSMTKKGKSFWKRCRDFCKKTGTFIGEGLGELQKTLGKK